MNLFELFFGKPVPTWNAVELNGKLKNGRRPLVIDVRQPEESRSGHIAGAKLIPLGELGRRIDELPQNREIVCVCASGNRSAQGRDILLDADFPQVSSMAGSLTRWRASGYPTVSGP